MSETLTNQIGEQLKAARLAKNMSLDDVQQITKIQVRYLEAIESNNLSVLPGDFYVRAFIRQYALAMGLNPEDLLGETRPVSISRTNDLSRAHRDNDGIVRAGNDTQLSTKSRLSNLLPTIWVILLVVIGLIVVWFALTHLTQGKQQSNDSGNVSVSTSTVPASQSSSTAASSSSQRKKSRLSQP
ncbi:helix-turn-helix domain-containing protein [Leuconostoc citreum]